MRRTVRNPVRLVPPAFLAVIALGSGALALPAARAGEGSAPLVTAVFTSASSVCVTGLAVKDTATYWSPFGQVVIMVLTQIGGFGVMAMATLLTIAVGRRLGLRGRLLARAENQSLALDNPGRVLARIGLVMLVCESLILVFVTGRLWLGYDFSFGRALWYGLFHAVSAFNNGGFALWSDSLMSFVGDAWICLPITFGVIAGSLGFPVMFELWWTRRSPGRWSTHTRLTVFGTVILLVVGFVTVLVGEWANPATLGPLGVADKTLAAFMQGTMPRSGGLNSVDYAAMHPATIAVVIALMFIGAGSAGTGGGIKITTFFLLAYVIRAEVKGERDVVIGHRRVAESTQRQAVSVALGGVALCALGTLALLTTSPWLTLERGLFEAVSAFGTVGLSLGVTGNLGDSAQVVLIILMFVGRVGTITVASALALTDRPSLYRYPEARPIVG
ncbi:TrkH family potassium uptake protein [Luedemannella helvata]|uniref:Potassium transporter TrkG n=1 Tax=Luedemannella helvata TaxID=349315 RepID=A0ABN2JXT2_9ACTN